MKNERRRNRSRFGETYFSCAVTVLIALIRATAGGLSASIAMTCLGAESDANPSKRVGDAATGGVVLSLIAEPGAYPNPTCHDVDSAFDARVEIGPSAVPVAGGQFLIAYDPTCMRFESAGPGSDCDERSPFSNLIQLILDETAGTVFTAVGIPTGGMASPGPATMVCLQFTKIGECSSCSPCFANDNPFNTRLTDGSGLSIDFQISCPGDLQSPGTPSIQCPQSVTTHVACNRASVLVTWGAPSASDSCDGPLPVMCTATHSGGANLNSLISGGGLIPIGTSTFCCEAANSCGQQTECCWVIQVNPAIDAECEDGHPCTKDFCRPNWPGAGPDGCVHESFVDLYGDVSPPGGDGVIDIDDIACVLNGMSSAALCPDGDIFPCAGNGVIDVDDITAVVDAYAGFPPCPHPCPP